MRHSALPVGKLDPGLLAGLLGTIPPDASVLVGPGLGCDVAVIDTGADEYLLLKSDPITFATDEIGHYAVTVNVNDIATAGGTPRWFLGTLLLPEGAADEEMVAAIYSQLTAACGRYGVVLVGGHTEVTHGLDRPILAGALAGTVARDELVTNSGTCVGDAILLTKGIAVEGTSIIAREKAAALAAAGVAAEEIAAWQGYLYDPGIGVLRDARAALAAARVHAMHDPTEGGVATGLWEMAQAAGVGLQVFRRELPILPATARACDILGLDPLGLIASGSLLIAVAPEDVGAVVASCAAQSIPCRQVAEAVEASRGCVLLTEDGATPLPRFDQDEIARLM